MYQSTDNSQYAYNPQYRHNKHQLISTPVFNLMLHWPTQLAPTSVSNAGLHHFNSKIRDDYKCILKHLTAPVSLTQISLIPAASIQAPSAQVEVSLIPALSVLAPLVPISLTQVFLAKHATLAKKTVTSDKDTIFEEVPNST